MGAALIPFDMLASLLVAVCLSPTEVCGFFLHSTSDFSSWVSEPARRREGDRALGRRTEHSSKPQRDALPSQRRRTRKIARPDVPFCITPGEKPGHRVCRTRLYN